MSVAQATASDGALLDLSSVWESKARHYTAVPDLDWAVEALLTHLHDGRLLTVEEQAALQSLSLPARSVLASKADWRLSTEAGALICNDLDRLYARTPLRIADCITATARISGVYMRWQECAKQFCSEGTSTLHSLLRAGMEGMGDAMEASIYDDLAGCQAGNSFQVPMQQMNLGDHWSLHVNRAARRLVLDRVQATEEEGESTFEEGALGSLKAWLEMSLVATLRRWQVVDVGDMHSRLEYDVLLELGRARSRQLFDIIKDFPLSSAALMDLNVCSDQCNLQSHISSNLSQALQSRLLHPGASTRDIIQFYTHLIRSLRYIDPSGVILSHVIGPVRTYLRARSDTISVIVASLLGQAGDFTLLRDMMRETGDTQALGAADTSLAVYDEDDEGGGQRVAMNLEANRIVVLPSADDIDWTPRPIDAGPDYRQSRKSDVIAIIVSIFDDEEGFVAALERSCAEQLVNVDGYETAKEYETNENLKKRFGDAPLSRCDVMLNDIKKSQRYDRNIQARTGTMGKRSEAFRALHPFVLSRQFWPPMKEAAPAPTQASSSSMFGTAPGTAALPSPSFPLTGKSFKMPGQFARALDEYQEAFHEIAPMQTLRWFHARGSVKLELEMNDGRRIKECVTPLQAAVVEAAAGANTQEPLSAASLVTLLEVDRESVMEALYFWTARGVLRALDLNSTTFEIVE